jgi:chromosome segregation ATPase
MTKAEMQVKIDKLEEEIEGYQEEIDDLKSEVTELEEDKEPENFYEREKEFIITELRGNLSLKELQTFKGALLKLQPKRIWKQHEILNPGL